MSEIKLELPYKKPDDEDEPVFDIHSQMDELYGLLQHEIKERTPNRKTEAVEALEEALMEEEISLETEKLEDGTSYPSEIDVREIAMADHNVDMSSDAIAVNDPILKAEPDPNILILRNGDGAGDGQRPTVVRKRVIRHGCQSDDNIILMVEKLKEDGDLDKAGIMIEKALEKNRNNLKMNKLMGKILFESGRNQESQRYFDRALTLNNLDPEPWLYLGIISLNSDPPNKMEALIFLQQARKLDPGNPAIDEYLLQCH